MILPLFLGAKKKRQKKKRTAAELVQPYMSKLRTILFLRPDSDSSGGVYESRLWLRLTEKRGVRKIVKHWDRVICVGRRLCISR